MKILRDANINNLEREVNSFILNKEVLDIKLSDDGRNIVVLIMYK